MCQQRRQLSQVPVPARQRVKQALLPVRPQPRGCRAVGAVHRRVEEHVAPETALQLVHVIIGQLFELAVDGRRELLAHRRLLEVRQLHASFHLVHVGVQALAADCVLPDGLLHLQRLLEICGRILEGVEIVWPSLPALGRHDLAHSDVPDQPVELLRVCVEVLELLFRRIEHLHTPATRQCAWLTPGDVTH